MYMLSGGAVEWSCHLRHYGRMPLCQNPFQLEWCSNAPDPPLALESCPLLSSQVSCGYCLCGPRRSCCAGSTGGNSRNGVWWKGVCPLTHQEAAGSWGMCARPFLDDPLLWVLMVGLVSSDSWDTGLMRLNLWFLTHLNPSSLSLCPDHRSCHVSLACKFCLSAKGIPTSSWLWNPSSSRISWVVF